jgi:hypothetical protein
MMGQEDTYTRDFDTAHNDTATNADHRQSIVLLFIISILTK